MRSHSQISLTDKKTIAVANFDRNCIDAGIRKKELRMESTEAEANDFIEAGESVSEETSDLVELDSGPRASKRPRTAEDREHEARMAKLKYEHVFELKKLKLQHEHEERIEKLEHEHEERMANRKYEHEEFVIQHSGFEIIFVMQYLS